MRKFVVVLIGIALGLALGYESRSLTAYFLLGRREPSLVAAFNHVLIQSVLVCDCDESTPQKEKQSLLKYESLVQAYRATHPNDRPVALDYALIEVRLSIVDQKLGNAAETDDYMKRGQVEFSALGWKDVSPAHLRSVVAHYDQLNPKSVPTAKGQSAESPSK